LLVSETLASPRYTRRGTGNEGLDPSEPFVPSRRGMVLFLGLLEFTIHHVAACTVLRCITGLRYNLSHSQRTTIISFCLTNSPARLILRDGSLAPRTHRIFPPTFSTWKVPRSISIVQHQKIRCTYCGTMSSIRAPVQLGGREGLVESPSSSGQTHKVIAALNDAHCDCNQLAALLRSQEWLTHLEYL
jgi:hypothetical protein